MKDKTKRKLYGVLLGFIWAAIFSFVSWAFEILPRFELWDYLLFPFFVALCLSVNLFLIPNLYRGMLKEASSFEKYFRLVSVLGFLVGEVIAFLQVFGFDLDLFIKYLHTEAGEIQKGIGVFILTTFCIIAVYFASYVLVSLFGYIVRAFVNLHKKVFEKKSEIKSETKENN